MSNEFITFMRHRVSQSALQAPAPKREEWHTILSAASRAPDHGNIKPWRFRIYQEEGRSKLGEVYWQHALSETSSLPLSKKETFIKKAYRAPAILLVYAHIQFHPKVPSVEQIMATSAAAQQAILGLNSMGYGTIWRSGPACFTQTTKNLLSLQETDQIVGLIYVGTPKDKDKKQVKVDIEPYLEWVTD